MTFGSEIPSQFIQCRSIPFKKELIAVVVGLLIEFFWASDLPSGNWLAYKINNISNSLLKFKRKGFRMNLQPNRVGRVELPL
jgi:hypothetical protein